MTKLTELERLISPQYLAGMVDADGCINIVKMARSKRGEVERHELRLQVTNTDKAFIEMIQAQFGGHIRVAGRSNPLHKTAYHWSTQGAQAESIIRQIQPYLIIKKERAEVALQMRATMGQRKGRGYKVPTEVVELRESLYIKMKHLNQRGLPV